LEWIASEEKPIMNVRPKAGKPAEPAILIDVPKLVDASHAGRPDPSVTAQRVVFGTSGHRGCSLEGSFNEGTHPCDYSGDLPLPQATAHRL